MEEYQVAITKFIDKMMNDNVFSARVESVESNEEVYNIAKELKSLGIKYWSL